MSNQLINNKKAVDEKVESYLERAYAILHEKTVYGESTMEALVLLAEFIRKVEIDMFDHPLPKAGKII